MQSWREPRRANWTGDASMASNECKVWRSNHCRRGELVRLGSGRVDLTASADKVIATARIVTPGTTSIDAGARIDRRPSVELMQSPLNGELRAATGDANCCRFSFPTSIALPANSAHKCASAERLRRRFYKSNRFAERRVDLYRYNLSVRELEWPRASPTIV